MSHNLAGSQTWYHGAPQLAHSFLSPAFSLTVAAILAVLVIAGMLALRRVRG